MQRYKNLPAFKEIARETPDIVVLTGDNVYLDQIPYNCGIYCCKDNTFDDVEYCCSGCCFNWPCGCSAKNLKPDQEYTRLLLHTDWPASIGWNPVRLATCDDHDYGDNNICADFDRKIPYKRVFLILFKNCMKIKKHWSVKIGSL